MCLLTASNKSVWNALQDHLLTYFIPSFQFISALGEMLYSLFSLVDLLFYLWAFLSFIKSQKLLTTKEKIQDRIETLFWKTVERHTRVQCSSVSTEQTKRHMMAAEGMLCATDAFQEGLVRTKWGDICKKQHFFLWQTLKRRHCKGLGLWEIQPLAKIIQSMCKPAGKKF